MSTSDKQHQPYDPEYVAQRFRFSDPDGRRWSEQNLSSPNPRPNLTYRFTAKNGVTYDPPKNGWKYTPERMAELDDQDRLHYPSRSGGRLRLKNYLDEMPGVPVQDVWTDSGRLEAQVPSASATQLRSRSRCSNGSSGRVAHRTASCSTLSAGAEPRSLPPTSFSVSGLGSTSARRQSRSSSNAWRSSEPPRPSTVFRRASLNCAGRTRTTSRSG